METKEQYLLEAKNLSKYFPVKNFFGKLVQEVRAVDRRRLRFHLSAHTYGSEYVPVWTFHSRTLPPDRRFLLF